MSVLVINCGSSSVKFARFDRIGNRVDAGQHEELDQADSAHARAIDDILAEFDADQIDVVGHRIVHGGPEYHSAAEIDADVLDAIRAQSPNAPDHNPYALLGIEAVARCWPSKRQVAVFDTAFHRRQPRRASTYALPPALAERYRIQRYGFHGISHEYVAQSAARFLDRPLASLRLISLHLGNGASACAVEGGRSADTSMGMTPLSGLVMGTRAGDIDSGIVLALLRDGWSTERLEQLLHRECGLAGLSGLDNDLRELERAAADGHDQARLAINVFAHRVRQYIGAYAAAMGGLDVIVFTGGIGENSASMRERILQRLEFLGVRLDIDANRADASTRDTDLERSVWRIGEARAQVELLVIETDEERMIAEQSQACIRTESVSAPRPIPIAVSARHCHLTEAAFHALFGEGSSPTPERDLSQPGQFASRETVSLIGPRDRIDGVRVLGPLRRVNQVEISRSDEFRLGVDAPVRNSGHVEGSAPITLEGPAGQLRLDEGLICARRHIHMHPEDAIGFGVHDGDEVSVAVVGGERDLVFGDVLIRVDEHYRLEMHIDTDEANAAEIGDGGQDSVEAADVYAPIEALQAEIRSRRDRR